jgi:DNA polymerase
MNSELLRQYLSFYQDLGIKTLYRRPADVIVAPLETELPEPAEPKEPVSRPAASGIPEPLPQTTIEGALPSLAPEGDTLVTIREDLGECTRCRLHEGRNKIVFGAGDSEAKIVFVGEGPGADEDAQGIPFVGRAGQLLTQMIENTAKGEGIPLLRKDVYICNVVKCRPPENRTPQPDEMEICGQFLFRQLMAIKPKAIVALGGTAAKALLAQKEGVTRLRGRWHRWHGIPVMVTFHPSFLLRPYNKNAKRESWEDLKKAFHYVYD